MGRVALLCRSLQWVVLLCFAAVYSGSCCFALPQFTVGCVVLVCRSLQWVVLPWFAAVYSGWCCLGLPQFTVDRVALVWHSLQWIVLPWFAAVYTCLNHVQVVFNKSLYFKKTSGICTLSVSK